MKWKVCGMRAAENIKEVVALQPDYMGFIFYPKSPRYVGADWIGPGLIPQEVLKVGVFVNEDMTQLKQLAKKFRLDLLQLHGEESPEYCATLYNEGYDLIKVIAMENKEDLSKCAPYKPWVKYFLFDTKSAHYGGTGTTFDWDVLDHYDNEIPLILSGGISLGTLPKIQAMTDLNLAFIDVNSLFETAPGIKDVRLLKELKKKTFEL